MSKKSYIFIMLLFSCCPLILKAQNDANNWQKLNLSPITIADATVHYDKEFEPNLPFFEKMYREFLAQNSRNETLNAKKDQILADINSIIGAIESDTLKQEQEWDSFNNVFSSVENTTFILIKQSTTKDFLRAGGTLPNFTYDIASDTVVYNPEFTGSFKDGIIGNFELAFPIASNETFENNVATIFQTIQKGISQNISSSIAIHELTESTLFERIKPTDPYWRWFSDGVANAITYELLKKHIGTQCANDFIQAYDVNNYSNIKNELNLQYWKTGNYCILLHDMPTEYGQRFNNARYAYATFEVRRLIDKYGIDCIRKIIVEISAKESRGGSDLLQTIQDITGEDMAALLGVYQDFDQIQDGARRYINAFNEASAEKNDEQMLVNLFRFHDLLPVINQQLLSNYRMCAILLFKMGFERQADTVMNNCIEFFSNPGITNGREVASEVYILYALEIEKPLKAQKVAEELLKKSPDNFSALTIQMYVLLEDEQIAQAKELAGKIISLSENTQSLSYKAAFSVLAIEQNQ